MKLWNKFFEPALLAILYLVTVGAIVLFGMTYSTSLSTAQSDVLVLLGFFLTLAQVVALVGLSIKMYEYLRPRFISSSPKTRKVTK
jgi:hypothetical protein